MLLLKRTDHCNVSDEQWDREDHPEDERGDNFAFSHLHKAALSPWDLQVPSCRLQHLQTDLGPVPGSACGRPGPLLSYVSLWASPFICTHFIFRFSFLRWSLWGRLVKAEVGCTSSVSFPPVKSCSRNEGLLSFYLWQRSAAFLNSPLRSAQSAGHPGTSHARVHRSGEVSPSV